ncbi:Mitochondrial resolvase Ydc2, catalytic [Ascosphaera apis ARSEF 7405]|uniref:Mitochondrial resolvase Ydc2, catalytic n=1 Tax=Ascosphaera apis ARSEF 7405 TaxID=392613 RepID=A0A167V6Q7_9EURO|nr:Mitochondrial resolvase Ydc2, catalytic [Ascosphaera apis ARSEF 7405]
MGIRNLAFAHIVEEGNGNGKGNVPVLKAWNRLDVSLLDDEDGRTIDWIDSVWRPSTGQIARRERKKGKGRKKKKGVDLEEEEDELKEVEESLTMSDEGKGKRKGRPRKKQMIDEVITGEGEDAIDPEPLLEPSTPPTSKKTRGAKCSKPNEETTTTTNDNEISIQQPDKESFSPALYARHAYSLLTSLITKYNPTHILLERQRFRSAGSSSVQEWTIRVGMFEAMLYAVLHTLRRERGDKLTQIHVEGVDPKKVARYWMGRCPWAMEMVLARGQKKKGRAWIGKEAKVNVLLRWLDGGEEVLGFGENELVHAIRRSYVEKCMRRKGSSRKMSKTKEGEKKKKTKMKEIGDDNTPPSATKEVTVTAPPVELIELDKLDDLADCVLQGVAWLEWEHLREELAAHEPSEDAIEELVSM